MSIASIARFALVLRANPARDARASMESLLGLQRAIAGLNKTGFAFRGPVDAQLSRRSRSITWQDADRSAKVCLVEDELNEASVIQVNAAPQEAEVLRKALTDHVSTASIASLIEDAATNMDVRPRTLVRLAFGAPTEWDDEVWALLARGMSNPDPSVRVIAVYAAAITMWPEIAIHLQHLLSSEQDPSVREAAERSLQQLAVVQR
jgi:hypothetical protein